jgi:magnesium-protoporphyrin O-methyltransferase
VACNCLNTGLGEVFGERFARTEARRFRKHGLTRRAQQLIEVIRPLVRFHEATLLEGGAGVGGVSIELLRHGMRHATIVDAVPAAVRMARTLAEEYGVAHRMSGVVADFAHMDDDSVHDLVVLDRVVCCYPDWRALLEAAADRASRAIALTYPREAWWTRFGVSAGNAVLWLGRRHFRLHVHPPAAMHALLRTRGFAPRVAGRVGIWEICVAPRLAEG